MFLCFSVLRYPYSCVTGVEKVLHYFIILRQKNTVSYRGIFVSSISDFIAIIGYLIEVVSDIDSIDSLN